MTLQDPFAPCGAEVLLVDAEELWHPRAGPMPADSNWVAVKELNSSYHNPETILSTIYICVYIYIYIYISMYIYLPIMVT